MTQIFFLFVYQNFSGVLFAYIVYADNFCCVNTAEMLNFWTMSTNTYFLMS